MIDISGEKMRKNDIRNMLLVFLVAFIPRLILNLLFSNPFRTPMDELSTIATGAYYGGADFSALTSEAGFYYGGGFSIFFAPLFRLGLEATVIYKIILVCCSVAQSLVAPIAYYILKKGFHIEDNRYNGMGAIACSYLMVTRSMVMFNEHIFILLCWLIALLFVKLCQYKTNYKKKSIYTVLLMFVLNYGMTVHARFQILWIAIPIVIVLFYWMYKRLFIAGIPGIMSAVVFYVLADKFNDMVKASVWLAGEGGNLKNTSTSIASKLYLFKDPVAWQGMATTCIGQANTAFIYSGGLLVIAIVVLLYIILKHWKQYVKRSSERLYGFESIHKWEEPYMLLAMVFLLCVGGMILAHGIRWIPKVMTALRESSYGGNAYGLKTFTYVRYIGPLLGPFALSAIGALYHLKNHIRKMLPYIVCAYGAMQLLWLAFVYPHISASTVSSEMFWPFSLTTFNKDIKGTYYLAGTLAAAIVLIVAVVFYYRKQLLIPLCLFALFISYQYLYNAMAWDVNRQDGQVDNANAGYECLEAMSEEYDLPEDIYVHATNDRSQNRRYTYQFLLYDDYRILKFTAKRMEQAEVVLCSKVGYKELKEIGYTGIKLDQNEFICVKDDKYIDMFIQAGYKVVTE